MESIQTRASYCCYVNGSLYKTLLYVQSEPCLAFVIGISLEYSLAMTTTEVGS
jgi:hypothetical protein